jgi:hypothetical protein
MHLGKALPKLSLSSSTRRLRLGVANHGTPSSWIAPSKEVSERRTKGNKKR